MRLAPVERDPLFLITSNVRHAFYHSIATHLMPFVSPIPPFFLLLPPFTQHTFRHSSQHTFRHLHNTPSHIPPFAAHLPPFAAHLPRSPTPRRCAAWGILQPDRTVLHPPHCKAAKKWCQLLWPGPFFAGTRESVGCNPC